MENKNETITLIVLGIIVFSLSCFLTIKFENMISDCKNNIEFKYKGDVFKCEPVK